MAPSYTRGSWFEQTWISTISGSFHINFSFPGPVVLEKIFKWHHPIFCIFVIIPLLKGAWSFIWTNLNPLHPRMICTKFDWIWPSGSGEEDENVKSLQRRQRRRQTTDKFWSEKLTWAFGSGELKWKLAKIDKCYNYKQGSWANTDLWTNEYFEW